MAEAKSWVGIRVADKAAGQPFTAFNPSACVTEANAGNKDLKAADTDKPLKDSAGATVSNFAAATDANDATKFTGGLVFYTPERGTKAELRNPLCSAETGNCVLSAKAT